MALSFIFWFVLVIIIVDAEIYFWLLYKMHKSKILSL